MKNKISIIVFLVYGGCLNTNAQPVNQIFKELKNLHSHLNASTGNLFFFNKYGNYDTSNFSDKSKNESLKIIKLYSMKRVNINFSTLSNYISVKHIKDESNFAKVISPKVIYTDLEKKYSRKLDSFYNIRNLSRSQIKIVEIDSLASIENLLIMSTHVINARNNESYARKKLLKILAIYESDKLLLIIYSIYISLTDSYIYSELILR